MVRCMTEQTKESSHLVNLTIDGKQITVPKGTTVYEASKQIGIDIPIFCYLDRMPPFGACRMCLVEVEKMGKLQASCTLEATEGMVVKTQSDPAVKGREEIIELLLINHPLDCPICDRGGECPLQDNTMAHGPGSSRFFEEKRHFKKPLALGPLLMLDRERCIACARCTRFSDLISGDHALEFIDRGYRTEVGTPDQGPAESKFIGNTIYICPVGALTSEVYRFRARPWDNDSTNSTCTLCPVGCSLILDSRDGELMRTRSCENRDVNDMWLCDKGWFGYEFTYHPDRLKHPLVRVNGQLEPTSWDEALSLVAAQLQNAKITGKGAGFGGNPLTVEENYLFQQLMRKNFDSNHLDHRIGMPIVHLDEEGLPPGMEMTLGECEQLSSIFLFGLDLTEEFPVMWLRLRQAINRGATTLFLGHFAPEVASYFTTTLLHAPGQELEKLKEHLSLMKSMVEKGGKGAIFVGRQYLNSPHRKAILSELIRFQQTQPNLTLNVMEGCENSMGARLAGMRPDLGPLGRRLEKPGLNAGQVLEEAARQGWEFLYVAGANPAVKFPSHLWREARSKLRFLVVQDLFLTETAQQADVVLPALSFVEKGGHFINIEGRVQKLKAGKDVPVNIYSDGEIFHLIAKRLGYSLAIDKDLTELLKVGRLPLIRSEKLEARDLLPDSLPLKQGELRVSFARALFDRGVRMKHDEHLIQIVKEPGVRIHPTEAHRRGIKEGDHVKLSANGNTITGKVKVDDEVAEGTAVLPLGFDQIPVHELGVHLINGWPITITKEG